MEKKVETLLVEKGQKYNPETGEGAIASLGGYRGELVFLPALPASVRPDINPGAKVRVILEEISKTDSRGRKMWRAKPAPDETEEVWEQDGDLLRRVAIRRNWCFAEVRRETVEERPAMTRDGISRETRELALFLEATLDDSFVLESKIRVIPEERETVQDGKLVWTKVGERREPIADEQHPILEVRALDRWDTWFQVRLEPSYSPEQPVALSVEYRKSDGIVATCEERVEWGKLPAWLQDQLTGSYPLCSCGRKRREAQEDGYAKCELCRAEETCERCGRQAKVNVIFGHLVCDACQPKAELELMINELLGPARLRAIAEEARALRSGQSFNSEEGIAVLGLALDHIASSYTRSDLLRKWTGYDWYHFTEDGVFGTKFAASSLELLELLPQAKGDGLIELVAWVVGGVKPDSSDYYLRTQVNGEAVSPNFTKDQLKQVAAKIGEHPVLADFLRGAEADRQKAIRELAEVEKEVGDLYIPALNEAREILQGQKQDYRATVKKLAEVREYLDNEKRLDALLMRDYPVCALCGGSWRDRDDEEIAPRDGASCDYHEYTEKGGGGEFPILRTVDSEGKVLVEAVVVGYWRPASPERLRCEIRVQNHNVPDLALVRTERLMSLPQFNQARRELARNAKLAEELARCEGTYPTRVKVTFVAEQSPERKGKLYADVELPEREDGWQFEYNGREYIVSTARLVCDPSRCSWLGEERPKAGETWVCSLGKIIGIHRGLPIIVANPHVRVPEDSVGSDEEPTAPSNDGAGDEPDIAALAAAWGAKIDV